MRGILAICMSAFFVLGCVERKEKLVISPQGQVLYQVSHRSDSLEDIYDGDAVPLAIDGWLVEQHEKQDDEGKSEFTFLAETVFPPKATLPSAFVKPSHPDASAYLQFPTTLKIERRGQWEYYHFSRTYAARDAAEIDHLREEFLNQPLSSLEGVEPQDWTENERIVVVKALAEFEARKALLFARRAYVEAAPDSPPDLWLAVQDDLLEFVSGLEYRELGKLLEPKATEVEQVEIERRIEAETAKFKASISARLHQAAREIAGFDGAQAARFMAAYDLNHKRYSVTEDLNDEKFIIEVQMPGEIIAANTNNIDGRTVTWSFEGSELHDREIELLVTSRVRR